MATTKKRINITLSPEMEKAISQIAKRDRVPEATKAAELIAKALMVEEDAVWEKFAEERFKNAKGWLTHKQVWG